MEGEPFPAHPRRDPFLTRSVLSLGRATWKQVLSMPPLPPNVICKLAQPLCPAPRPKISYLRPPFSVSNKIIMQNLCMFEVKGAWDHVFRYLYFVNEGMEDRRNEVIDLR